MEQKVWWQCSPPSLFSDNNQDWSWRCKNYPVSETNINGALNSIQSVWQLVCLVSTNSFRWTVINTNFQLFHCRATRVILRSSTFWQSVVKSESVRYCPSARVRDMNVEVNRVRTYRRWEATEWAMEDAFELLLAKAGFYATEQYLNVKCHFCGVTIFVGNSVSNVSSFKSDQKLYMLELSYILFSMICSKKVLLDQN